MTEPSPRLTDGPYDTLYSQAEEGILWGWRPTHLLEWLNPADHYRVLDAGCGDGVNSLHLEKMGFRVNGFDMSRVAIEGLQRRFALSGASLQGHYKKSHLKVEVEGPETDVLLSCGLFHCLEGIERIDLHRRLQGRVKVGGVVLFSTLMNEIPMPEDHRTPSFSLAAWEEINELFSGWHILLKKGSAIKDEHPPTVKSHTHAVGWVVAARGV
jgi:2-polyprenyl-3-methyl-5-hydroxy-6-metoxy-1,4-benzoquinol methylase